MSETNETRTPPHLIRWLIAGGIFLLVVIVGASFFFTYQGIISKGNQMEATMSAQYADGANYLSSCLVQTSQAANVAGAESEALQEVFATAIGSREYGEGSNVDEGALFSAIVEAYPDVSGLEETFQQVIAVIVGCRSDFAQKQTVVLASVERFNQWRTGDWTVRWLGGEFPNDNLYISVGSLDLRGQEALAVMQDPIVDNSTIAAYEEGSFEIDDPFESDK